MQRVIDGKLYDTDEAERIATWKNGDDPGDFRYCSERLYKTDNGRYFIYGKGGAMSSYAKSAGNNATTGSSAIRPISESDALEWCERKSIEGEIIADEFDDHIEPA
jgi:hypothetical protein